MAHHLVDAGAHTLRVALIVEAGRNGIVVLAVLHTDIIYLLGVHTRTNSLCHSVETTRIHYSALADAFYLFWSLDQLACRN